MTEFGEHIDFEYFKVTVFSVLDMDGDGIPEVILETQPLGDILVLYYYNGVIHGYTSPFRGLKCVKKDGTFNWSSGAADNGYDKLQIYAAAILKKAIWVDIKTRGFVEIL